MRKGEIWFVEMPGGIGHEQKGLRPVILFSEVEAETVMVIPLTSNVRALKFPHTIEIAPSIENGLKSVSIALVFQLRAIDIKRIKNKIGVLESADLGEIERLVKDMLQL